MKIEEIADLVNVIQLQYDSICIKWNEICSVSEKINLKKYQVKDIRNNVDVYNVILKYRAFLNENLLVIGHIDSRIARSRVKLQNSIESKIERYMSKQEKGCIPIKKCINDLYGVRVIVDTDMSCGELVDYVRSLLPEYKIIDSSKDDYKGVHIYFSKGNDFFQWELQIWRKQDEADNYTSHNYYKQEYTMWEKTSEESE